MNELEPNYQLFQLFGHLLTYLFFVGLRGGSRGKTNQREGWIDVRCRFTLEESVGFE